MKSKSLPWHHDCDQAERLKDKADRARKIEQPTELGAMFRTVDFMIEQPEDAAIFWKAYAEGRAKDGQGSEAIAGAIMAEAAHKYCLFRLGSLRVQIGGGV